MTRFPLIGLSMAAWVSAVVGWAAQGGRFSHVLDLLTHVAPLYVAIGVVTLCIATLLRASMFGLVLPGLASLVAGLVLMLPDAAAEVGPRAEPGAATLKIIQFNAWGGNRDPEKAATWLLAQGADIIVLEEGGSIGKILVRGGRYRWGCEFCSTMILSKNESVQSNGSADWRAKRPEISAVTFLDNIGEFTVLGVHLPWPNKISSARGKYASLEAMVSKYANRRLIIVGDFNSTPWSFGRQRDDAGLGVLRRTRNLFSWPAERVSHNRLPAPFPVLPIDHVYAGRDWATISVRRGPRLGSDHYPIVVVLAPAADDGNR